MSEEEIVQERERILSVPAWDWDEGLDDALEKMGREYFRRGESNGEREL